MTDRKQLYEGLREYVSRELLHGDDNGLDEQTPLLEWGVLDSLGMVGLISFIEERWKIHVPETDVRPDHFKNLGSLIDLLVRLPPKA